ncbi:MAG: MarC family protein [Flavobacteriales bacterium]|nr:MarC family protein [Flavobacteriales bacterium]
MDQTLIYLIASFSGLFAIMNPIAMTPFFITLTKDADDNTKKAVAFKATLIAFIIVSVFVISGSYLFKFFGITIPSFKIFGGFIISIVAVDMIQSKKPSTKNTKIALKDFDIGQAISPLATPILAGPGTIVTAMNYVHPDNPITIITTITSFAIVILMTYAAFRSSEFLTDKLGSNVIQVISKIMGLIIGVIGVDMIISGIKLAFNL